MKHTSITRSRTFVSGRFSRTLLILSLGLLAGAESLQAAPPPGNNWTVSFTEDFNSGVVQSATGSTSAPGGLSWPVLVTPQNTWNVGMRWNDVINSEIQGYDWRNISVENGVLRIKVEKRVCDNIGMNGWTAGDLEYASGAIQTYNRWTPAYGYYEARVKMANARGTWPAFWLLPDRGASVTNLDNRVNLGTPAGLAMGNEIDVFEYMGSWQNPTTNLAKYHCGYFWNYTGGVSHDYVHVNQLTDPNNTFHTYGVYWGPNVLIYYVDGTPVMTRYGRTTIATAPHYLILNCAMSVNDWTGTNLDPAVIDADLLTPKYMEVDYVKVYTGTPAIEANGNVALGGTVSAQSSQQSGFEASRAIDGIANTDSNAWTASGAYPQWIEVDLGANKSISATELVSVANRDYFFRVEAKPNGGTYQTLVDRTANVQAGPISDHFGAFNARFVKLTITGANTYAGGVTAIREFRVFATSSVYEAEKLLQATSSDALNIGYDTFASNAVMETLDSNAVGDHATYTVPVSQPGIYTVKVRYKRNSTRGQFQLAIDGVNQGSVQDQYGSSGYAEFNLGNKTFTTAGDKLFKFTVTGKNASSSGFILSFDNIKLDRVYSPTFEAENIPSAVSSDALTLGIDSFASGGAVESLAANATGDYASYTVPVAQAGTYNIKFRFKRYTNRGRFQLDIDGVNQGAEQDQYGTSAYVEVDLGAKTFSTAGNKVFRFTVTGKNSSSGGYVLSFDNLRLVP